MIFDRYYFVEFESVHLSERKRSWHVLRLKMFRTLTKETNRMLDELEAKGFKNINLIEIKRI